MLFMNTTVSFQLLRFTCFFWSVFAFAACSYNAMDLRVVNLSDKSEMADSVSSQVQKEFPLPSEPHFVKAFDENRWIIGNHESVWITQDAGQTWSKTFTPSNSDGKPINVRGASFGPNGRVFLATDTSLIKSYDAGLTWGDEIVLNFQPDAIYFLDDYSGWAVVTEFGDNIRSRSWRSGAIFRTQDGGFTWNSCKILDREKLGAKLGNWWLSDLLVLASGRGLAVGDGVILSTEDFGDTWKLTSATPYKYLKVNFRNDVAWALTVGNDVISISNDNGASWKDIKVPDNRADVLFAEFIDRKHAVLGMNRLFLTHDGGKHWTVSDSAYYTFHVEVLESKALLRLVIIDEKSFAEVSIDKGRTWKPLSEYKL